MTDLILAALAALAVAAVGTAWYFRRTGERARRRAELLREHADRLTLQLVAAEQCVGHLAATVIPAAAQPGQGGTGSEGGLLVPAQLEGTPLAERLRAVPGAVASAVEDVRSQEHTAAELAAAHAADRVRQDTERRIEQVRQESVGVARAAVRGFANNVVARSARLGRSVSQGVRRHISDEAYATLVEIDHLAQQMLLTAAGYSVLAGDKLSRRWPATHLTDIVRAAMGRIEGYERIKHPEMGSVVVEGRAVEAVVHALAVLLDNALRYSPPAASVHVSLEQGHHACFLIVDDAGLRMDDERLLWASDVMSGEQRDDITRLGAHPQTGLRVASLLAENYGFRVELTAPNIYQGTRAMVVLPKNLLVDPAAAQPVPQPVPRPAAPTPVAAPAPASVSPSVSPSVAEPAAVAARVAEPAATLAAEPEPEPARQHGSTHHEPAHQGPAEHGPAEPVRQHAPDSVPTPGQRPEPESHPAPQAGTHPAPQAGSHPVPHQAPQPAPHGAPHPVPHPTPQPESQTAPGGASPGATTASGLTVRRRSTAPAPARRPAAPDDTEPGRPAVAAAWAAGTRRGRQGENAPDATADATRTAGHGAAHDEGH
ncbi:ATP-binding protein [Streptomyces sp. NBC_00334]|uniref:ATP-binding protein n=1 Tax=Streptomyces sp. NBC_00334 TaxID=2975713 RepID=UPI002E2A774B|nr:ATP-binding protein [Streptomyces sp. NBC_00334]